MNGPNGFKINRNNTLIKDIGYYCENIVFVIKLKKNYLFTTNQNWTKKSLQIKPTLAIPF